MSETTVRQDWCPIHGHVKVQRFSPRAKFSWWECLQCGLASKPAPVGTQCDPDHPNVFVTTEGSAAPRREDATEPKTIDLMQVLTDSLARREDAAGVGRDPNYLQTAPCLKKPEYGNGRCHHVDCLLADRNAIAAALSTAERERDELRDAMDAIYVERYGITYRELEERVRAVQNGEYVTHEEAMQRIRASLPARVPSGGET